MVEGISVEAVAVVLETEASQTRYRRVDCANRTQHVRAATNATPARTCPNSSASPAARRVNARGGSSRPLSRVPLREARSKTNRLPARERMPA